MPGNRTSRHQLAVLLNSTSRLPQVQSNGKMYDSCKPSKASRWDVLVRGLNRCWDAGHAGLQDLLWRPVLPPFGWLPHHDLPQHLQKHVPSCCSTNPAPTKPSSIVATAHDQGKTGRWFINCGAALTWKIARHILSAESTAERTLERQACTAMFHAKRHCLHV